MKELLAVATLLAISSWSVVNAQQQAPSLKPSMSAPAARPEGPPPLLLEIAANPALPPGYSNVNGPKPRQRHRVVRTWRSVRSILLTSRS